ncbi:hypothetical protein [Proteus mirabilis]|uniref:Prophage protein n=1 Tax=Proteus mirabilis TaxID=584 RepID=A0AAN3YXL8_PROMI|nr:hypothetical protein [Proteus mirabilis]AUU13675.1 hypothetical protein MC53_006565 [Proteus mirabilis]EKU0463248.1 hypothetical protein [Proteus mirabilis]EKU8116289.1 hypothetical protein [Proteus mirabilis]EKV4201388.1 hypothetical protein [Proteus mirabilis]EKV5021861.1 hypothetical protein [Proteus mirabilis]
MNISNINAFEHSEQGVILITEAANQEAISYTEALEVLNDGSFDGDLIFGFELVLAICKGECDGFFNPTNQQRVILWRWIVAASFVAEQADNNGTHQVDNGRGKTITAAIYRNKHAALTVYAASERMLLANHIEGAAYEHYGAENGAIMAVKIYRDFINLEPKRGCRLSERGREGLSVLHDDLIRAIEDGEFSDTVTIH